MKKLEKSSLGIYVLFLKIIIDNYIVFNMCGIAGIINLTKKTKPIEISDISIMKDSISSRGPDAESVWRSKDKDIILVSQRLATQDNRPIANQPCFSSDKSVLAILNGEIFNHEVLKEQLIEEGYKFLTKNDTEVLANAYHFWGNKFLDKIDGQFAFAVFDKKKRKVIIARDQHGICPLYYYNDGKKFYFSSTPESIHLQLKLRIIVNKRAVKDFMVAGSIYGGDTFFQYIKYLDAGSFLEIYNEKKFNNPRSFTNIKEKIKVDKIISKDQYVDKVLQALEENVEITSRGDKEIGLHFSGGLDSTLLLALYKNVLPQKKLKTFTASFVDIEDNLLVGHHDLAKKIADHYGYENRTIRISSEEMLKSIGKYSLPSDSIIDTAIRLISEDAKKKNVEVALSGEGADELFLGYDHQLAMVGNFNKNFNFLLKKFKFRNHHANKTDLSRAKIEDLFLGGGADIDFNENIKNIFSENMIKFQSYKDHIKDIIKSLNLRKDKDIDKILFLIDYKLKLPQLHLRRCEGPSMSAGVETRFPFLQKNLINLVLNIPIEFKIGNDLSDKHLLREVAKKVIPEKFLIPKTPFGLPASKNQYFSNSGLVFRKAAFRQIFFKNYLSMREEILDSKFIKLGFFKEEYIKKSIKVQSGYETCFFDKSLWKIWNLCRWYERFKFVN